MDLRSLAEYDNVSMNISMIMSGIDPQTKKFTEPPEQIKQQIAAFKSDKSVPEAQKKEDLAQLEAALKERKAHSVQGKHCAGAESTSISLRTLMQEQGPAD